MHYNLHIRLPNSSGCALLLYVCDRKCGDYPAQASFQERNSNIGEILEGEFPSVMERFSDVELPSESSSNLSEDIINQFDSNQYSADDCHQENCHQQYEEEEEEDMGSEEATADSEEQQVLEGLTIELMTLCMEIATEQLEHESGISVSSNGSSGSCHEENDQRSGLAVDDEDDSASRGSSQSHTEDESDLIDEKNYDSCSLECDVSGDDRRSYRSGSENSRSSSESEDGQDHCDQWSDEDGHVNTGMQEDDASSEGLDT